MITHNTENAPKTQDLLLPAFKKLLKPGKPLIGIDYGAVRIGVAISDKDRQMATPFKVIAKLVELDDIVRSKDVCGFVVGLPLQTDGTEGDIARQVRLFTARLTEKYALPVYLTDERYTSKIVQQQMDSAGIRAKKQRQTIDAKAAALILQRVLNELM